jgi:ribosomal protein S18 acetylase RimI-like enzyme
MLIRGDGGVGDLIMPADVQRAVGIRPAAELSKLYLMPDYQGSGVAAALMEAALATAAEWGVRCVWLGVNQENQRAQRFYVKSGFNVNGTRTFQVGARRENDYVMVRELG